MSAAMLSVSKTATYHGNFRNQEPQVILPSHRDLSPFIISSPCSTRVVMPRLWCCIHTIRPSSDQRVGRMASSLELRLRCSLGLLQSPHTQQSSGDTDVTRGTSEQKVWCRAKRLKISVKCNKDSMVVQMFHVRFTATPLSFWRIPRRSTRAQSWLSDLSVGCHRNEQFGPL